VQLIAAARRVGDDVKQRCRLPNHGRSASIPVSCHALIGQQNRLLELTRIPALRNDLKLSIGLLTRLMAQ
jgi:hypothetical protein